MFIFEHLHFLIYVCYADDLTIIELVFPELRISIYDHIYANFSINNNISNNIFIFITLCFLYNVSIFVVSFFIYNTHRDLTTYELKTINL
jgi:hypothetical protein